MKKPHVQPSAAGLHAQFESSPATGVLPQAIPPAAAVFIEHAQLRQHRRNATIVQVGAVSDSLFCIKSGQVAVVIEGQEEGQEVVMRYLGPGELFGEMGLFESSPVRSALIRAKTSCEIAQMSYVDFREFARAHVDIMFHLSALMVERLKAANRKVGDLTFMDAAGRIAGALLELCRQDDAITHPDGMMIRITRQELAKVVGCSREMVGRVLKDFEEDGLIMSEGKSITVFGVR